jgi:hypothetical protein
MWGGLEAQDSVAALSARPGDVALFLLAACALNLILTLSTLEIILRTSALTLTVAYSAKVSFLVLLMSATVDHLHSVLSWVALTLFVPSVLSYSVVNLLGLGEHRHGDDPAGSKSGQGADERTPLMADSKEA